MSELYQKWVQEIAPLLDSPDIAEIYGVSDSLMATDDFIRWSIGDFASKIEITYGGEEMKAYARYIGLAKGTVENRRTLADFWKPATRFKTIEQNPNVRWSMYKVAMSYGKAKFEQDIRCDELQCASDFVGMASANGWTIEEAWLMKKSMLTGQTIEEIIENSSGSDNSKPVFDDVIKLTGGRFDGLDLSQFDDGDYQVIIRKL